MTREELKKQKEKEEKKFIKSIVGREITGKEKDKFRTTDAWKTFRNQIKKERQVDELTGRKLTKTWNCHHRRTDSRLYTKLNKSSFLALNNQQHKLYHIVYEEMRKDPTYLDRLKKFILKDLNANNWESFVYKKNSKKTTESLVRQMNC